MDELQDCGLTTRLQYYGQEAVWKDVIRTNACFSFVQQFEHIGILAGDTRSHGGMISEYDPDT